MPKVSVEKPEISKEENEENLKIVKEILFKIGNELLKKI